MWIKGLLNHSLKSLCDTKMFGIKKCRKAHSSIRSFCSGVPVSSSLLAALQRQQEVPLLALVVTDEVRLVEDHELPASCFEPFYVCRYGVVTHDNRMKRVLTTPTLP